jgi:hypothetical protein
VEQRRTSWTSLEDHQWDIDKNRKATHREGEAIVHAPRGAVRYGSKRAGYERLSSGRAPNDRSAYRRLIHPLAPPCDGARHPGTQHVWRRRPRMGHERRDTQAGHRPVLRPCRNRIIHVRLPSAPPIRPGWVGASISMPMGIHGSAGRRRRLPRPAGGKAKTQTASATSERPL